MPTLTQEQISDAHYDKLAALEAERGRIQADGFMAELEERGIVEKTAYDSTHYKRPAGAAAIGAESVRQGLSSAAGMIGRNKGRAAAVAGGVALAGAGAYAAKQRMKKEGEKTAKNREYDLSGHSALEADRTKFQKNQRTYNAVGAGLHGAMIGGLSSAVGHSAGRSVATGVGHGAALYAAGRLGLAADKHLIPSHNIRTQMLARGLAIGSPEAKAEAKDFLAKRKAEKASQKTARNLSGTLHDASGYAISTGGSKRMLYGGLGTAAAATIGAAAYDRHTGGSLRAGASAGVASAKAKLQQVRGAAQSKMTSATSAVKMRLTKSAADGAWHSASGAFTPPPAAQAAAKAGLGSRVRDAARRAGASAGAAGRSAVQHVGAHPKSYGAGAAVAVGTAAGFAAYKHKKKSEKTAASLRLEDYLSTGA